MTHDPGRSLSNLLKVSALALALTITHATGLLAGEPAMTEGTGGPAVLGEVSMVQVGERQLVVGIDDSLPLDGLIDHLVRFTAATPLDEHLDFRGRAMFELDRDRLFLLVPESGQAFELSLRQHSAVAPALANRLVLSRMTGGTGMIVTSADFGEPLSRAEALARDEEADIQALAARIFQKDPSAGDDDGCAVSCNKSCKGDAGSCSVSCPAGQCAKCSCNEVTNVPSCGCTAQ